MKVAVNNKACIIQRNVNIIGANPSIARESQNIAAIGTNWAGVRFPSAKRMLAQLESIPLELVESL